MAADADAVELAQLKALQTRLTNGEDVKQFDRLDTYGKWLLGSFALVSAGAAAVSYTGAAPATGLGRQLFSVSQLVAFLGLIVAAVAIIPRLEAYNPHNVESMQRAVEQIGEALTTKGWLVRIAGTLFAIGLVGATLSPLLVSVPGFLAQPHVDLTVTGTFDKPAIKVRYADALPHRDTALRIAVADPSGTCPPSSGYRSVAMSATDSKGQGELDWAPLPDTVACVIARWGSGGAGGATGEADGEATWVVSLRRPADPLGISYTVAADGTTKATLAGIGLMPGSMLVARFGQGASASACPAASADPELAAAAVGADGTASVSLTGRPGFGSCVQASYTPGFDSRATVSVWVLAATP